MFADDSDRDLEDDSNDEFPVQVRKPRKRHKSPADQLHLAVWNGDYDQIRHLVHSEGVFVESWNVMGQTPLFVAAYTGKPLITSQLLNMGADPNVRCVGGYTATHGACYAASRRILALILKFGGDLEIHDVHRQIPIDWAHFQPDERKRNRILEFLESLRQVRLRRIRSSSPAPSSPTAMMVAASAAAAMAPMSPIMREEKRRKKRSLHRQSSRRSVDSSRYQSTSLPSKRMSPPRGNSTLERVASKNSQDYTFTRRFLAEERYTRPPKDHWDYLAAERNLSEDSDYPSHFQRMTFRDNPSHEQDVGIDETDNRSNVQKRQLVSTTSQTDGFSSFRRAFSRQKSTSDSAGCDLASYRRAFSRSNETTKDAASGGLKYDDLTFFRRTLSRQNSAANPVSAAKHQTKQTVLSMFLSRKDTESVVNETDQVSQNKNKKIWFSSQLSKSLPQNLPDQVDSAASFHTALGSPSPVITRSFSTANKTLPLISVKTSVAATRSLPMEPKVAKTPSDISSGWKSANKIIPANPKVNTVFASKNVFEPQKEFVPTGFVPTKTTLEAAKARLAEAGLKLTHQNSTPMLNRREDEEPEFKKILERMKQKSEPKLNLIKSPELARRVPEPCKQTGHPYSEKSGQPKQQQVGVSNPGKYSHDHQGHRQLGQVVQKFLDQHGNVGQPYMAKVTERPTIKPASHFTATRVFEALTAAPAANNPNVDSASEVDYDTVQSSLQQTPEQIKKPPPPPPPPKTKRSVASLFPEVARVRIVPNAKKERAPESKQLQHRDPSVFDHASKRTTLKQVDRDPRPVVPAFNSGQSPVAKLGTVFTSTPKDAKPVQRSKPFVQNQLANFYESYIASTSGPRAKETSKVWNQQTEDDFKTLETFNGATMTSSPLSTAAPQRMGSVFVQTTAPSKQHGQRPRTTVTAAPKGILTKSNIKGFVFPNPDQGLPLNFKFRTSPVGPLSPPAAESTSTDLKSSMGFHTADSSAIESTLSGNIDLVTPTQRNPQILNFDNDCETEFHWNGDEAKMKKNLPIKPKPTSNKQSSVYQVHPQGRNVNLKPTTIQQVHSKGRNVIWQASAAHTDNEETIVNDAIENNHRPTVQIPGSETTEFQTIGSGSKDDNSSAQSDHCQNDQVDDNWQTGQPDDNWQNGEANSQTLSDNWQTGQADQNNDSKIGQENDWQTGQADNWEAETEDNWQTGQADNWQAEPEDNWQSGQADNDNWQADDSQVGQSGDWETGQTGEGNFGWQGGQEELNDQDQMIHNDLQSHQQPKEGEDEWQTLKTVGSSENNEDEDLNNDWQTDQGSTEAATNSGDSAEVGQAESNEDEFATGDAEVVEQEAEEDGYDTVYTDEGSQWGSQENIDEWGESIVWDTGVTAEQESEWKNESPEELRCDIAVSGGRFRESLLQTVWTDDLQDSSLQDQNISQSDETSPNDQEWNSQFADENESSFPVPDDYDDPSHEIEIHIEEAEDDNSRRVSTMSAKDIEDLYCDDELQTNLLNNPNMQLSVSRLNNYSEDEEIKYPPTPMLVHRDSILTLDDENSSGPSSIDSEEVENDQRFATLLSENTSDENVDNVDGDENADNVEGDENVDNVDGDENADIVSGDENADNVEGNENDDNVEGDENDDNVDGDENVKNVCAGDVNVDNVEGDENADNVDGDENDDNVWAGDVNVDNVDGDENADNVCAGDVNVDNVDGDENVKNVCAGDVNVDNVLAIDEYADTANANNEDVDNVNGVENVDNIDAREEYADIANANTETAGAGNVDSADADNENHANEEYENVAHNDLTTEFDENSEPSNQETNANIDQVVEEPSNCGDHNRHFVQNPNKQKIVDIQDREQSSTN